MQTVVLTIHLLLALALIGVVLLQRSEGGGLGMGGGGGVMSGRAAATALSKVTWILGGAFVITSLALTVIAARESGSDSVLDRLGVEVPADTPAGTMPDLGGQLLPPGMADAPATPPAADAPAVPPAIGAPAPEAPAPVAPEAPEAEAPEAIAPPAPEAEAPAAPEAAAPEAPEPAAPAPAN